MLSATLRRQSPSGLASLSAPLPPAGRSSSSRRREWVCQMWSGGEGWDGERRRWKVWTWDWTHPVADTGCCSRRGQDGIWPQDFLNFWTPPPLQNKTHFMTSEMCCSVSQRVPDDKSVFLGHKGGPCPPVAATAVRGRREPVCCSFSKRDIEVASKPN